MADQRQNSKNDGGSRRLSGRDAIARVREDLPALLGKPIESVLGLERQDDNGWKVTVAVVELSRIPPTTDVIGAYAVLLDGDGEVTGYRRERRYHRNQADED